MDNLDDVKWSDGGGITEMDKRKIGLAVDRFWGRRIRLLRDGKPISEEKAGGIVTRKGYE